MLCRIFILHAVEACYEEKLGEARREAEQDCNYATDRVVSTIFVSWWKLSLILSILALVVINVVTVQFLFYDNFSQ